MRNPPRGSGTLLWATVASALLASGCHRDPARPECGEGELMVCECRDPALDAQVVSDFATARTLQDLGHHEAALVLIQRVINVAPDHAQAHFARGFSLQIEGRHEEALRSYDLHLRSDPEDQLATFNVGYGLMSLERWGECVEAFQRHLTLYPDSRDAYFHLATCHDGLGQSGPAASARAEYEARGE